MYLDITPPDCLLRQIHRSLKTRRQSVEPLPIALVAPTLPKIIRITASHPSASAAGDFLPEKPFDVIAKILLQYTAKSLLETSKPRHHFLGAAPFKPDPIDRMGCRLASLGCDELTRKHVQQTRKALGSKSPKIIRMAMNWKIEDR
jgi:hypothetical protein